MRNEKGFTFVELIIVVAIIGILSSIAIPMYRNYITTSKQKSAEVVIEQLPVLIETYRAENGIMCPACNANGNPHTYSYTVNDSGTETTPTASRITNFLPDFRAKTTTSAGESIYHYQIDFTVTNCPNCIESAVFTAIPQAGRGAPIGNIVSDIYQ